MRKTWLAPVLLAVALVLQLTVSTGCTCPAAAYPTWCLLLVVALAIADGPVRRPGHRVRGWACAWISRLPAAVSSVSTPLSSAWRAGRLASLAGAARRSPLRALAVASAVIAAAEAVAAGLGLLLEPAQVTAAEIRQFLPVTIAYDLLLWPFVLYLVVLASTGLASTGLASTGSASTGLAGARLAGNRLAGNGLAGAGLAGHGPSGLAGARARSRRAERKRRPHEPRLGPGAAGLATAGSAAARRAGARPRAAARRPARLHPGAGVAGSASGVVRHRDRIAAPVHLRLTAGRRGDGAIGNAVGRGQPDHWQRSRHPGLLAGGGGQFRPHGGEISGSAARQHAPAGLVAVQARINFGGRRGDANVGRLLGTSWLSRPARTSPAGPRLRKGAGRSALSPSGRTTLTRVVPKVQFRNTAPPVARRPAAAPKFRRGSAAAPDPGLSAGLVAGGVLDNATFRARRGTVAVPRLRLAGSRSSAGMLGGSGRSALRRPPARIAQAAAIRLRAPVAAVVPDRAADRGPLAGEQASRQPVRRVADRQADRGNAVIPASRRRLVAIMVIVAGLLGVLGGRLWYLQVQTRSTYVALASQDRIREIVEPSVRGKILDDTGQPMVSNQSALVVAVNMVTLQQQTDGGAAELARLARLLNVTDKVMQERVRLCTVGVPQPCWPGSPYQPIPVAQNVSDKVALQILENKRSFPGVTADIQPVIQYAQPISTAAAQVLGYLQPITAQEVKQLHIPVTGFSADDLVGQSGLEAQYDKALRGATGVDEVAVNAGGQVTSTIKNVKPVAGDDLVTSINAKLQIATQNILASAVQQAQAANPGATSGAAVVLTTTGRVVAMASYPTYNPSHLERRHLGAGVQAAVRHRRWRADPGPGHPGRVPARLHVQGDHADGGHQVRRPAVRHVRLPWRRRLSAATRSTTTSATAARCRCTRRWCGPATPSSTTWATRSGSGTSPRSTP